MSVLEHLPTLQIAVKELRKIQADRKKAIMDEGTFTAEATVRAFRTETNYDHNKQTQVSITKNLGQLHLTCGWFSLPCNLILYGCCVNNIVTVHLKDDEHFPFKKIIFKMRSIQDVEDFISKLKLPEKPRPDTYRHDGNVTSSSADSDSGRSGTGGVNNSYESDNASNFEDR